MKREKEEEEERGKCGGYEKVEREGWTGKSLGYTVITVS